MATQSTSEKGMRRQAVPVAPVPAAKPALEAPQQAEPVAQWQDTIGDRLVYLFWLLCFALLLLQTLGNTLFGFLF